MSIIFQSDRGISNEYSDDDEEQDFSSGEDNDDGLSGYAAKRDYASKRNYRKLERGENDNEGDDSNLGANQVDSDSEFENPKGSRANKISRVSLFELWFCVWKIIRKNYENFSNEISSKKL